MFRRKDKKGEMAQRRRLDTSLFEEIIDTGEAPARLRLGRQLARLVADGATHPQERMEALPCLLRLLMDPHKPIRAELARILTPFAGLHPDIIFTIAADDDDIALPFLERSTALRGKRQLAILRAGDVARLRTMARRADLDPEAVELICREGEAAVVAVLLDNAAARPTQADLKRVYARFRGEEAIVRRLLERADLPLEVRIAHVHHVAGNLRKRLRIGGWLPGVALPRSLVETEERALAEILSRAKQDEELARAVAFASSRDILTPAVIFRAAAHGHLAVLVHAMAYLGRVSPRRVRAMIGKRGSAMMLRALYRRCGLPEESFMLVRAMCDVARKEGLPLEPGAVAADFGLKVLERLATGYDMLGVAERARLSALLAQLADERTRTLAQQLDASLRQAA